MWGVRHGSPLLILLQVIATGYLPVSLIRITGMQKRDHETKTVNFAENTNIFLRDITCLNRIKVILKLYEDKLFKNQSLWAKAYENRVDQPGQMEWSQFSTNIPLITPIGTKKVKV